MTQFEQTCNTTIKTKLFLRNLDFKFLKIIIINNTQNWNKVAGKMTGDEGKKESSWKID